MSLDDGSDFYGKEPLSSQGCGRYANDVLGDSTEIDELQARAQEHDAVQWWDSHKGAPNPLMRQASQKAKTMDRKALHNPYTGFPGAWQLEESVDSFLGRCPPATTDQSPSLPWIFICNPYVNRRPKARAHNQSVRGCEDEAPEDEQTDLHSFVMGGNERLEMASEFIEHFKKSGRPPALIEREKKKAGVDAARDIRKLAQFYHVRTGKFMIFTSPQSVNEVWAIIAKTTASNELGIAAKVAPRPEDPHGREGQRLICVYTADFEDTQDNTRVALQLRDLGLTSARSKPLYYKPDAYTYMGISAVNPWGIKASLFSTRDLT